MLSPRRYRPSMRSHRTLAVLTVVSLIMYLWANGSHVTRRTDHYDTKLEAAQWMQAAMDTLRNVQFPRGMFIDDVNDPNLSAMIGQQFSPITTETGDLETKWTALNPNVAAIIVDYFVNLGLQTGDQVAVGMSGSIPGMNLAMYAACQAMGLQPIVITSAGASSWGANDPMFTWLDMENILIQARMLAHGSVAASLGGGDDLGRQLSPEGRRLLHEAIQRSGAELIEEPNLEASVERRVAIYDSVANGSPIKLYMNIGGGLASLGHTRNSSLVGEGVVEILPNVNYPRRGVIHAMNGRGIPVLNVVNVGEIAREYALPRTPNPLPAPGTGHLFSEDRYNMWVTAVALLVVLATLIVVVLFDRRAMRLDRPGVDPDTLM